MIYLRLSIEAAVALHALAKAAGLSGIVAQLEQQEVEKLIPSPTPELAIWRKDYGPEEVFPEEVADAMYRAMVETYDEVTRRKASTLVQQKEEQAPLFAESIPADVRTDRGGLVMDPVCEDRT